MNKTLSIEVLTDVLESNGVPEDAAAMEAYMKHKFSFYGLKSPKRRSLTKDFIKASKSLSMESLIILIDDLWDYDERDYQMVGIDVILANKKRFEVDHIGSVRNWIVKKSWWDTVDMIGANVLGIMATKSPEQLHAVMDEWIADDNIWLNRCSLIFQLKMKEKVDYHRLFKYILMVNHKRDFFIQKAIGWSLRQASKFHPEPIQEFIDSTTLSNLAVREGSKYLQ